MMRDKMEMYSVRILRILQKARREENLDQSERAFLTFGISLMDLLKYGSDVERYWNDEPLKASIRTSAFSVDLDAVPAVAKAIRALEQMNSSIDFDKFISRCSHTLRAVMDGTQTNKENLDLSIQFFLALSPAQEEIAS